MMTVADIHNVTFEKAVRGYRAEEVDNFLARVAQEVDALQRTVEESQAQQEAAAHEAQAEQEDLQNKIYILAEKIEEYRKDEDNLKTALLNAQRLGETVVNEAKQKAEAILSESKAKAIQTEKQCTEVVRREEKRLAYMKNEVAKFKNVMMSMYKQHIDAINQMPGQVEHAAAERAVEKEVIKPASPKEAREAVTQEIYAPETEEPGLTLETIAQRATVPAEQILESFENYQGIQLEE